MRGYVMPLGNPARSSAVDATVARYGALRRAVSSPIAAELGPPVAIAIEPTQRYVLYHYRRGAVMEVGRDTLGLAAPLPRDSYLAVIEQGVVVGDEVYPWSSGPPRNLDPSPPAGRLLTSGMVDGIWLSARQNTADTTVDAVTVRRNGLQGPANPQMRVEPGYGAAAMSPQGRVGMVLNSHRFLVLNPASLHERVDQRLEAPSYLIAAIDDGWVIASATPDSDAATPPVERRARAVGLPGFHYRGTWKTRIERREDDGSVTWFSQVPFPVLQPPVDGGEGRVIAVGKGLAAIESGRVLWHKPANVQLLATAFGDGHLAVAGGFSLRIVDPAGETVQTIFVPDRSRIVTLPAIGPDGAIYVGTNTGIYVAR